MYICSSQLTTTSYKFDQDQDNNTQDSSRFKTQATSNDYKTTTTSNKSTSKGAAVCHTTYNVHMKITRQHDDTPHNDGAQNTITHLTPSRDAITPTLSQYLNTRRSRINTYGGPDTLHLRWPQRRGRRATMGREPLAPPPTIVGIRAAYHI